MNARRAVALLTAIGVLAGCSGQDAQRTGLSDEEATSRPSVQSPETSLPARWWIWAEEAGDRHPIVDRTGADCGVNQPDDVWFLPGTFGGPARRTCTVPAGQPIYFPVMNRMCEVGGADVERVLSECDPEAIETSATLDGDELEVVSATSEGSFTFQAGPRSLIATSGARFDAVAGGEWVGPLALSEGRHLLEFAGRSSDFELDVTYELTVD